MLLKTDGRCLIVSHLISAHVHVNNRAPSLAMYRQASPEFDEEATALSFLFVFAMCGHMLATNWQQVFDPTEATMRWWAQEIELHLETVWPLR